MTREQLNATPPELRHYTCQQCGKNDTDRSLFKMIVTFGIGFVLCRDCLSGDTTAATHISQNHPVLPATESKETK